MAQLYKYLQTVGGEENWRVVHADTDFETIKPTFITVLALDTLNTLPKDKPSKELLNDIKYLGPMYFDMDSDDLEDSIACTNQLATKLEQEGLLAEDMEIFLSGKKGLHLLIDPSVFMSKVTPLVRLPAIYKEMAFKFATDTTDFKVYTARTGRLLRTCYNVRENGNYRVPVTLAELRSLTVEHYNLLCKAPRQIPAHAPAFRAAMALVYEAAKQKIHKVSSKKAKPVDAKTLLLHLPIAQQIMTGDVLNGAGFNKVAIQLAIYAREAGITEDQLVIDSAGLLTCHLGDGNRYNTPSRREAELRRMVGYVEENSSYDYSVGALRALLSKPQAEITYDEEGQVIIQEEDLAFSSGVMSIGNAYVVSKGEAGDAAITNFVFTDIVSLIDLKTEQIIGLKATLTGLARATRPIILNTTSFTGSSSLQNAVSAYGGSFTGSDIHARGILQIMLHKISESRYVLDSEGINVVNVPMSTHEVLREPFIVWADSEGVRLPKEIEDTGVRFDFSGHPDPLGVIQTDLTLSPTLQDYLEQAPENRTIVMDTLRHLFSSHDPEIMGKFIGWMTATFWRQQFNLKYAKFPLLHVYGPAGLGKTEMTVAMLHMFYYNAQPQGVTPSSTPFSLLRLVAGSGSIPVLMDEYKPAKMSADSLERYRAVFRDAYNMKDSQRGGGSRTKAAFDAINKISLTGPIIFVAEAPETETAIIERVVLLSIKKPTPMQLAKNYSNFIKFSRNLHVMSAIGHSIAAAVVADSNMDSLVEKFDDMHEKALAKFMLQEADHTRHADGLMTDSEFKAKASVKARPVFNSTVVLFGLTRFRNFLRSILGDEFETEFGDIFTKMQKGVFQGLSELSASTSPEYIKLLTTMGDMTQLALEDKLRLTEGVDYNLSEIGGRAVLVLVARASYIKYRMYCRQAGTEFYYQNELSFTQAIKEVPEFLKLGRGTTRVQVETIVLDLEDLHRNGVSKWAGKSVQVLT